MTCCTSPNMMLPPSPSARHGATRHVYARDKNIQSLLHKMQRDKQHMALSLMNTAGLPGLVTIEDIVEEIRSAPSATSMRLLLPEKCASRSPTVRTSFLEILN